MKFHLFPQCITEYFIYLNAMYSLPVAPGKRWQKPPCHMVLTVVPGRWCQQGLADMAVLSESNSNAQWLCWDTANKTLMNGCGVGTQERHCCLVGTGNTSSDQLMTYATWLGWSDSTHEWCFGWGFCEGLEGCLKSKSQEVMARDAATAAHSYMNIGNPVMLKRLLKRKERGNGVWNPLPEICAVKYKK